MELTIDFEDDSWMAYHGCLFSLREVTSNTDEEPSVPIRSGRAITAITARFRPVKGGNGHISIDDWLKWLWKSAGNEQTHKSDVTFDIAVRLGHGNRLIIYGLLVQNVYDALLRDGKDGSGAVVVSLSCDHHELEGGAL